METCWCGRCQCLFSARDEYGDHPCPKCGYDPYSEESYEVTKAKDRVEALAACKWKIGDLAEVVAIKALPNSDGTYTVYPMFMRYELAVTKAR